MQCGDHNCVDGGILTGDDYETENVIELVISSLDLINSSINNFNILQTPQGLNAKITNDFQGNNITWNPVPSADYYHLYWLSDFEEGWNIIPFITSTNYTHYYEDSTATYHYKLIAVSDDGSSSLDSNIITFTPSNPVDSPANLAANLVDLGQAIRISWNTVKNASTYELQWSEKGTPNIWNTVSNLTTTSYDHYFNDVQETYSYKVIAINANGIRSDESETIVFSPSSDDNTSELTAEIVSRVSIAYDKNPSKVPVNEYDKDGYAYITPSDAVKYKGSYYWTNYAFKLSSNIDSNNISLKIRAKSNKADGAIEARDLGISLVEIDESRDEDTAWTFHSVQGSVVGTSLMGDSWGQSYTSARAFESSIGPFSEAVVDMDTWHEFELHLSDGTFSIKYDGNTIKTINYDPSVSHSFNGIGVSFKGSAFLDYVHLYKNNELKYGEDF